MDLYRAFNDLHLAGSAMEFTAVALSERRRDFLAKASDGSPVFLLHDASAATYSPAISLKNVSVQFHNTCRVTTATGTVEDQFAVVACDASVPDLYELFIRCFAAAVEQLPMSAGTGDLDECVHGLLDLFRALNRPNSKEVTGLWAELFVITTSRNVSRALEAWHADQFERFDFSWPTGCLEVKAAVKEVRVHDFALEQLQAPMNGQGMVASLLLQPLGGGVGVMDLARNIEAGILAEPLLRQKLWANVVAALGSDFSERLDRRFDVSYVERHLAVFMMSDVPAPDQPSDPRITGMRFRSDLSSVQSSLADAPADVLNRLFR